MRRRIRRGGRVLAGAAVLALVLVGLTSWREGPTPAFASHPTLTSLSASTTSAVTGQLVTFTATVTCPPLGIFDLVPPSPTGQVTFTNTTTGATLGTRTVVTGGSTGAASLSASFTVDSPFGTVYGVRASYAGNGACEPSTSNTVTISVSAAPSDTQLFLDSLEQGYIGAQPILRARVFPGLSGGQSPVATGGIAFLHDTGAGPTLLGTRFLDDDAGVSRFEVPPLMTAGTHRITAEYLGDHNYHGSTSAPIFFEVLKFPTDVSFVTFPTSPTTASPAATVVVRLASPPGFGNVNTPRTGTVQLNIGGSTVATQPLTGSFVDGNVTFTVPLTPGDHTVTAVYSGDSNFEGNSASRSVTVTAPPDTTAPTTAATPSGTLGFGGWFRSNVTVTLAAADNPGGSGIEATYYNVDGSLAQSYGAPFLLSGDGTHTVTYWSVDNAGNTEAAQTLTVKIDTVAPVVTCTGPDGVWHSADFAIICTPSDATSGLFNNPTGVSFQLLVVAVPGVENPNASSNQISVGDNAGWVTVVGPFTGFKTDRKPPTVVCDAPPVGWQTANVSIACTATDGGSGPRSADASFTLSTNVPAGAANGSASTGTRQVCDNVGNCVTAGPLSGIQVDRQAPTTTATPNGTTGSGGWYTSAVTVTLAASDGAGSGIHATYYTLDGGSQQTYTGLLALSADGARAVTYWSVDNSGNIEVAKTLTVKIDSTPPAVSCGSADGVWHAGNVTISCAASDSGSGLGDPGDANFSLSTSVAAGTVDANASTGSHEVCDAAGHCVTAGPIGGIKVDRKAPTTTATPSGTSGAGGWYLSSVTVTLVATDGAGSGVAQTYYRVNAGAQQTYGAPITLGNGTHTMQYWSVDAVGNVEAGKSITVKVDATAPSCVATASPNRIWPANKKLVPVTITIQSLVGASGIASVVASAVSSNELLGALDVVGFNLPSTTSSVATLTGQLRADREARGDGRTYSQTYTVTNGAGATTSCSMTVIVPRDQGR